MIKISKELKIGFIAVFTILLLIFGINFLKGKNIFENNRSFYAVYSNISGLQTGSSVLVNGYQVGAVGEIILNPKNPENIIVLVNINKEFDIPKNSMLKITNQDLMGTKAIALIMGNSNSLALKGDTLLSSLERSLQEEVNKQILPLKSKAEGLIGSVDSIITVIASVLSKDARESLTNSLVSLDKTFETMSQTMEKVDKIVEENDSRVNDIMQNLHERNDDIASILSNLSSLSGEMKNISKQINNSEGSLGLLVNDKRLYENLEKSSKELADLIEDIKKNPKKYFEVSVFGGKSN